MSNQVKAGDLVYLKSDTSFKILMTVEGPTRSATLCGHSSVMDKGRVGCVWVDSNENVRHDDFGAASLTLRVD